MSLKRSILLITAMVASLVSGCASYRTESNIPSAAMPMAASSGEVLISEDSLTNRKYKVLGPIEVSIKKLTVFHSDPTKEMANQALVEKARAIGADAIIEVTYKAGIGLTTWGYLDASGKGVKLAN
ncbi:MAG: hypothetical protein ACOYMG_17680 [Candidatus Methylumidiphilus sp.]